ITFTVVQLLQSGLLNDWSERRVDPLYAARIARLRTRLTEAGTAALVVVLGSSRSDGGVIGAALENRIASQSRRPVIAFNLASGGCGPVMELVALRRLLRDGVRPAVMLVEVFPALLADSDDGAIEGRWLHHEEFPADDLARVGAAIRLPMDPSRLIWIRTLL